MKFLRTEGCSGPHHLPSGLDEKIPALGSDSLSRDRRPDGAGRAHHQVKKTSMGDRRAQQGEVEADPGARFLPKEHTEGEGENEPCGALKTCPQILLRDLESATTLCSCTVPASTLSLGSAAV